MYCNKDKCLLRNKNLMYEAWTTGCSQLRLQVTTDLSPVHQNLCLSLHEKQAEKIKAFPLL